MKRVPAGRLVRNAVALMLSSGGSAALGVVFWGFAAHLVSVTTIGRTSAEIAAMTLVATLAQLGIPSMFERFLPISGGKATAFIVRSYLLCGAIAVILSGSYLAIGLGGSFLEPGLIWRLLFVAATTLWTIFTLQDSVLVGLRATHWVPVENILYSGAKLALMPAFILLSKPNSIFLAWMSPVIVAIIAVNWYLFDRRIPDYVRNAVPSEQLPSLRQLIVIGGAQYSTLLINVLTPLIVILVVIRRLGPVSSAHYYLPSLIAGGIGQFLASVIRSFLVEASTEPDDLRRHSLAALRATLVVLAGAVGVGVAAAPQILGIFGASYATNGTTLLRLLLLSLIGYAVTDFYSAFALLDRKIWRLAAREFGLAVLYFTIVLSLIDRLGILALGVASIVNSSLQGLLFLRPLVRRYRAIA